MGRQHAGSAMTSRRAKALIGGDMGGPREPPLTRVDIAVIRVNELARSFERRWSLKSLAKADSDLYQKFKAQQGHWHEALVTRDLEEVQIHTDAMCGAWAAATRAMEQRAIPEDAFLVGRHEDTIVVIGESKAGDDELRALRPGQRTIFVTPDEVAVMVNGLGDVALQVKEMWPGAEIKSVKPVVKEQHIDDGNDDQGGA